MRNALVVLVPLCVGLTSGFIVPSGLREVIDEIKNSFNSIHNSGSKSRNMLHTSINKRSQANITASKNGFVSSKQRTNDTLETELYDGSDTKDLEVKERSFIYIKQRGIKPSRVYSSNTLKQQANENNTHKSYLLSIDSIIEEFPSRSADKKHDKNDICDNSDPQCFAKLNKITKYDENTKLNIKVSNDQRDYLELLKAPLLRPEVKTSEDETNLEKFLLKYLPKNEKQSKNNDNILYPGEYQNILAEDTTSSAVGGNAHKNVFLLDSTRREIEDHNIDNDHLIFDIIKNNLRNPDVGKISKPHINHNGFQFCRDCINKARKYNLNNRLLIETLCKCEHNLLQDNFAM